jgi:hypothetical protein
MNGIYPSTTIFSSLTNPKLIFRDVCACNLSQAMSYVRLTAPQSSLSIRPSVLTASILVRNESNDFNNPSCSNIKHI